MAAAESHLRDALEEYVKRKGIKGVPDWGFWAMMLPILYEELFPKAVLRHCARWAPIALRPLPEAGFSPCRIR